MSGRALARQVEDSPLAERTARLGLVARGVLWSLVGVLAASVAVGGGGEQADQGGALRAVGSTPGGTALLLALSAGFLAYAAYQLLCAAVGHRAASGVRRALRRAKNAGEALLHLAAAASCVRAAVRSAPDSEQQTRSATAAVMGAPGGRLLVGAVGAVAVAVAVALVARALVQRHHADRLRGVPRALRRPVTVLGVAGYAGRSLALGLVGGFLVSAALRFRPDEARGLDAALDAVRGQPFGRSLLLLAAASFLAYGLWSFVEAAWRDLQRT
jgi:hypothetical protein